MCRIAAFVPVLLAVLALLPGCPKPKEAIGLSNSTYDFGLNERPYTLDVWNTNDSYDTLTVTITPSVSWISVDPGKVTCAAPTPEGVLDKHSVLVTIDRTQLTKGTHEGSISFTSKGIVKKTFTVYVEQAQDGTPTGKLNFLSEPVAAYSAPYLLDFSFSLVDDTGAPVVAEPAQFDVVAKESGTAVSETAIHLQRNAARQLRLALVLDYSLSMQTSDGAIEAMEDAAKDVLLPSLNADALVSVYEFHADDRAPAQVVDFTTDKELVSDSIDLIQNEFVGGFASGSRLWDAVVAAATDLGGENTAQEERIIVVLTDGYDTSSLITDINDVIDDVDYAGAHVYAVGFGADINEADLQYVSLLTGGEVLSATVPGALASSFQDLVDRLGARYVLRWATLRRSAISFTPSFTLTLAGNAVTHNESAEYTPADFAGNVREGLLRFVPSANEVRTTVFLRAEYMPQQVSRIRMYVDSSVAFAVSLVSPVDDGLVQQGTLVTTNDATYGGTWIDVTSTAGALPFASFGPLLRFDFTTIVDDATPLFDQVYVDPSIYTQGQSFEVIGYPNTPPGGG